MVVIVEDASVKPRARKLESCYSELDLNVLSLSEFRSHADWNAPERWNRYNYAHVHADLDRTGEIQTLIDEMSTVPEEHVRPTVSALLDAFVNAYHRSLKDDRDGLHLASRLDAAASLSPLIAILFAVERRVWPYNKYLEWELEEHPLRDLPWSPAHFLAAIERIVTLGDIPTQIEIYRGIERAFRAHGYGVALDRWKGYYLG